MDEPRRITSLGHTRWSDAPAATLDARLGAVLLDNITSRLALIDREQRYLLRQPRDARVPRLERRGSWSAGG